MRIINVTSNTNAYVIIRNLNLKPGASGTIDVDILVLSELKSLRNLYLANDIIISEIDFNYIVAKIESLSGDSCGAPPIATKNSLGVVIVSDYLKIDTSGKLSVDFETTFNTQLNNYALKTEIPLLERTPSSNTLPVLANRIPLYSLGTDGNFVLCTPNAWIKLDENLFMPAYTGEVLGLHP